MARISRDALRGKVQTVLGPIAPEQLGPTLMHEHLLLDLSSPVLASLGDPDDDIRLDNLYGLATGRVGSTRKYRMQERALMTEELARMVAAGGRSVVELTNGGLKPDPDGLAAIARATGAHIVMGCGWYVDEYQDHANENRTVEQITRDIVDQVLDGAWGTRVRAGMIGEIGCQWPWTNQEKKVMHAAVIAQQATGASINVHPGRHEDQPQEAADFIVAHGGDIARVVISHIDRTIFDLDRLLRLADTGCTIEFDLFGTEYSYYALNPKIDMPNDGTRLKLIRALIDRGHLGRVVISHDICYLTRLVRYGGHGYGHIFANVVPMMRARDFSAAEIDAILIDNPKRLLTFV
ncbi:MAG: aryldialkylphosphatase [Alphaproteobacteria bacterium]|nr:aryldialkylphosphatase [Alphaproteobacteria bacterium]